VQRDLPLDTRDDSRSLWFCVIARLVIIVLFWTVPLVSHAACSLKPNDVGFPFSDAALEARDAFFASLCDESFAELVVDPDPRLKERFRPASHDGPLENPGYPAKARQWNLKGKTVVAYVIETDGSVEHVIVIQSSGYQLLDDTAVDSQRRAHFYSPGALDGIPVRVLATRELLFAEPGHTVRVSATLTDGFIATVGAHLIDLCNRADFDTLYDELDEQGQRDTSRIDLKRQLRLYNGLYGLITAARFEGVLREATAAGSKIYELAYALDLERPGAENVLLTVTVAEHPIVPRVRSFRIDRRITIRRRRPASATPP
jgi:TonB family protein